MSDHHEYDIPRKSFEQQRIELLEFQLREVKDWMIYLNRFLSSHGSFGVEGRDRHEFLISKIEKLK